MQKVRQADKDQKCAAKEEAGMLQKADRIVIAGSFAPLGKDKNCVDRFEERQHHDAGDTAEYSLIISKDIVHHVSLPPTRPK